MAWYRDEEIDATVKEMIANPGKFQGADGVRHYVEWGDFESFTLCGEDLGSIHPAKCWYNNQESGVPLCELCETNSRVLTCSLRERVETALVNELHKLDPHVRRAANDFNLLLVELPGE